MTQSRPAAARFALVLAAVLGLGLSAAFGLKVPERTNRFDALAVADPSAMVAPAPVQLETLPAADPFAGAWRGFKTDHGEGWRIVLDRRSGAPQLVEGQGIPWIPGSGNNLQSAAPVTTGSLAASIRALMSDNPSLFLAKDSELVLNAAASGPVTPELWQIQFDHVVSGVPVAGDQYVFYIGHGNLMEFGAPRWSAITASPVPALSVEEARARLFTAMGLTGVERLELVDAGSLSFLPVAAAGSSLTEYAGPAGAGYDAKLAWKFVLRVDDDSESWVGMIDAVKGTLLAFYDDNRYAQVKGGVYTLSNDGSCPTGCEQPNYPLPFANVSINGGGTINTPSSGMFSCSPAGGTAVTTLNAQYVRVVDSCGAISVSTTCDSDLDLKTSAGTNCTVPAGTSAGDTHAARTSFYHLNRIKEHARAWLPSNTWLTAQLRDNVNINLTCNAFWSPTQGTVNFYRSGGGCFNTGEIAAVFLHEWGHGLDQNDGGGNDNPGEAYADITSIMLTHASCIGRGFTASNCSGYGNACLNCTGVREVDWNQRANHAPSTPEGFVATCPSQSPFGPCLKEGHCEAYMAAETLWDFAVRDLPASGLDANTSWQLADKLWFKSRQGSSGDAYGCGSPASNRSCVSTSWFSKMRVIDDDDGNLANGTPHAAAIFAAFNRHNITCGAAGDAANQSTSSCPALATPSVTATPAANQVSLSWAAVPNATSYNILRNDIGCGWGFTIVANVAGTSYTDTGLANGFNEYYSVQAIGSNTACMSALATCATVAPGGPVVNADLGVTKTDGPDPVTAGSNLTYTLNVTNAGADAAATVALSDSTPANTTFQSISTVAGWSCSTPAVGGTGAISCTNPSLASGGSASFTLVVKVNFCVANGTMISNTATISSATPDSTPANNSATATTTVNNPGCDDGNVCTMDTCNVSTGCAHSNAIGSCNDGNACTTNDSCSGGICVGGPAPNCDDGNVCTTDSCSVSTGCVHTNNTASCSDGNACTTNDACSGGVCVGGPAPNCDDGNVCTTDSCNVSTGCVHTNNTAACSDGSVCTTNDACSGGVCVGGPALNCNDGNPCTTDSCNAVNGCQHANNTASCSDGNVCTTNDACSGGACVGGPPPNCDDGSLCTNDSCTVGVGCVHVNNTVPCDDGSACTTNDACSGGACVGGPAPDCSDGNVCTDDSCSPASGCQHTPNNASCDDGEVCTTNDFCSGGVCVGGNPPNCNDNNPCTTEACIPGFGCSFTFNTNPCDDGSACTTNDTCSEGVCVGGPAPNCDDGNECTDDACSPAAGCTHTNNTSPCSDGSACTTADTCIGGVCAGGVPPNCDDANVCTEDSCDPETGCTHMSTTGGACDDHDLCTTNDTCSAGVCVGGAALSCDDGNVCTSDTCSPVTGCVHQANTASCNDGNSCTADDVCSGGACGGTPLMVPGDVSNLLYQADKLTLTWDSSAGAGPGTVYDVPRGVVHELPAWNGSAETCVASGISAPTATDGTVPQPDQTFYYLVRAHNACGTGGYGFTSEGAARVPSVCP